MHQLHTKWLCSKTKTNKTWISHKNITHWIFTGIVENSLRILDFCRTPETDSTNPWGSCKPMLRQEGNVSFNNALNTFYLWLYGVRPMLRTTVIVCVEVLGNQKKKLKTNTPKNPTHHVKEGNVSFNDALNTFYLHLYGVGPMLRTTVIVCVEVLGNQKKILKRNTPKKPTHHVKEGNVSFNDALNTFYLRLYGIGPMLRTTVIIRVELSGNQKALRWLHSKPCCKH